MARAPFIGRLYVYSACSSLSCKIKLLTLLIQARILCPVRFLKLRVPRGLHSYYHLGAAYVSLDLGQNVGITDTVQPNPSFASATTDLGIFSMRCLPTRGGRRVRSNIPSFRPSQTPLTLSISAHCSGITQKSTCSTQVMGTSSDCTAWDGRMVKRV